MMNSSPYILAIDTSCDDTSAAVTAGVTILSNVIASQTQLHKPYGGVFPTIAKQAHKENIDQTVKIALQRAGLSLSDIDAVAVTQGPGLAPALEVGIEYAKHLSIQHNIPLIAVNHIEGHALSALAERKHRHNQLQIKSWTEIIAQHQFPALTIVVSGGHTEFIKIEQLGSYERLGFTIDDAAGEALDKVGRMLDLGYPAGPVMEEFAKQGSADRFDVPLPMTEHSDFNLSFSGLKTWARNKIEDLDADFGLDKQVIYDFTASFQNGVFKHICYKLNKLLQAQPRQQQFREVWLGGGVAANMQLRRMIRETLRTYTADSVASMVALTDPKQAPNKLPIKLYVPYTKRLCMDNAAMIGMVGGYKILQKQFKENVQNLDRKPRWKIDQQD